MEISTAGHYSQNPRCINGAVPQVADPCRSRNRSSTSAARVVVTAGAAAAVATTGRGGDRAYRDGKDYGKERNGKVR